MSSGPSIFVVVEGTGAHSDRCETLLFWYSTREQAEARKSKLEAKARQEYGTERPDWGAHMSDDEAARWHGAPDYEVQEVAAGFAETHLAPPEGGR